MMQFLKLNFENKDGKKLAARLDLPADEKPLAYALFAHCFTCTKNLTAVVNINRSLAKNGIAVLRFDFTGLGESEGEFSDTNFSSNVEDLVAAAHYLEENFAAPKLLIGHSLGGAAVLQAASRIPSAVAVATIAAPSNPGNVTEALGSSAAEIEVKGEAEVTIGGKTFKLKRQFLEDLEQVHMQQVIRNLRKPLLIFHSPHDETVSIDNAEAIYRAARHPKSFISLGEADHLMTNRNDSKHLGTVLAAWAQQYLEVPEATTPERDLRDNRVVVRTGKIGYQTEIKVNEHRLIADEPIAIGGADTGPNPYGYLVAALGACTSITLRMYADRKGWPLDSTVVRLKHEKVHADDCRECETQSRQVDSIEREIELVGALSEEQRKRLLQIADRCPVHHTLQSKVHIETRLKE